MNRVKFLTALAGVGFLPFVPAKSKTSDGDLPKRGIVIFMDDYGEVLSQHNDVIMHVPTIKDRICIEGMPIHPTDHLIVGDKYRIVAIGLDVKTVKSVDMILEEFSRDDWTLTKGIFRII